MFYELSVPVDQSSTKGKGAAALKAQLAQLQRAGYGAVALEQTIGMGRAQQQPSFPHQLQQQRVGCGVGRGGGGQAAAQHIHVGARPLLMQPPLAPVAAAAAGGSLETLTRLTIELDDAPMGGIAPAPSGGGSGGAAGRRLGFGAPGVLQALASRACATPLSHFDIVAVRPRSRRAFEWLRDKAADEFDLLSVDLADRLPFSLESGAAGGWVGAFARRGVGFEVCVGRALADGTARRHFIANGSALVRATRGQGVLLSCGAREALGVRAPADVASLGVLLGLRAEGARRAMSTGCSGLLRRARTRHAGGVTAVVAAAVAAAAGGGAAQVAAQSPPAAAALVGSKKQKQRQRQDARAAKKRKGGGSVVALPPTAAGGDESSEDDFLSFK